MTQAEFICVTYLIKQNNKSYKR